MKTLYRKLSITFSTLILLAVPYNTTRSCGPDMYRSEQKVMLFRQYLAGLDNLQMLYYTPRFAGLFLSDPSHQDYWRNCREWQKVTGKQVSVEDIYAVQYDISPDFFLYAYTRRRLEDGLQDNTFIQWLYKPEHKEALAYLCLAKKIEFLQFGNTDPWESGNSVETYRQYDSIAAVALERCKHISNSFIKERYAFQAVKALYYSRTPAPVSKAGKTALIACYNKYLLNKNTIVADWGMLYYALSLADPAERTLYLAKAFDRSEEKKGFISGCISRKELLALDKKITDPETKAIINAMAGIKQTGQALPEIQQVCKHDPRNRYLPLLICREVNKLEDWVLSPELLGFDSQIRMGLTYGQYYYSSYDVDTPYSYYAHKNLVKDKLYLQQVRDFLITALQQDLSDKNLVKLAIAHLYQMENKFPEAQIYLSAVKPGNNARYKKQKAIAIAIDLIHTGDISAPAVQEQLYQQFSILGNMGDEVYTYPIYEEEQPLKTLPQLYLLLSEQFRKKGDLVKAGLLRQRSGIQLNRYTGYNEEDTSFSYARISFWDQYAAPQDIDNLLHFKHRKAKSHFEKLITPVYWPDDAYYLDVKGTLQLRQQQYKEALLTFSSIPENFWQNAYLFEYYLPHTYIGTTRPLIGIDKKRYGQYKIVSKKRILEDVVALTESLRTATDRKEKARLSLLLGNAYFNMTYYGNAWMMVSYGKSSREMPEFRARDNQKWAWYQFYPNTVSLERSYYQCADAIRMYKQALAMAGDQQEIAAQANIMLGICDDATHGYLSEGKGAAYHSPFWNTLKNKYQKTKAYTDMQTNCPDAGRI